jgi:hypothetical protein
MSTDDLFCFACRPIPDIKESVSSAFLDGLQFDGAGGATTLTMEENISDDTKIQEDICRKIIFVVAKNESDALKFCPDWKYQNVYEWSVTKVPLPVISFYHEGEGLMTDE